MEIENIYLKHLYEAFKNVDYRYYSSKLVYYKDYNANILEFMDNNLKEIVESYPERVYAYELYHQLRKIIENNQGLYENLRLNSEISKITQVIESNKKYMIPDLVLHKCQSNNEYENQIYFAEIKTKPDINKTEITKDLNKLFYSVTDNQYNYQFAVFIVINNNFKKLARSIKEILEYNKDYQQYNDKLSKVFLLANDNNIFTENYYFINFYQLKYNWKSNLQTDL